MFNNAQKIVKIIFFNFDFLLLTFERISPKLIYVWYTYECGAWIFDDGD